MGPGALFKPSSGLSALVWSKLLSFAALSWLSLAVAPTLWPCLADCFLCLVLDFLPWTGQCLALVTVTRTILMWLLNSTLSPGTPLMWKLGWGWCCLGPALLSWPRQDKGSAWWGHSPKFLVEQPSPVVSNTWKLGTLSSGSFTAQLFFSSYWRDRKSDQLMLIFFFSSSVWNLGSWNVQN